ncbi:MAG: ATP-binding cassette domain-containing protein [Litorilinea sp.]
MLVVNQLEKHFNATPALRNVSFQIAPGEIVGLLGPNGAGKTTTIKILTGFLQPDAGTAHIDGLDVVTATRQVQARIGYLPESAPLYRGLSVQRYLQMMADLRQIPTGAQTAAISDAVYATNLENHLTRPIAELSKGFRQRVGLAQAILHRPRLLILDEPTIGLDPTQLLDIRRLIKDLAHHTTILFSTHILSEVEALCDRVIMLLNGEVRADARLAELAISDSATLVLQTPVPGIEGILATLPGVTAVEHAPTAAGHAAYPRLIVTAQPAADLCPRLYAAAREHNWPLRELRQNAKTLESVFNRLVVQESQPAATQETGPPAA